MKTYYKITNWNETFENNRSREIKKTSWVPVPNKMDGDGFTELMDHPSGAAHFGAWILLVEVASKCQHVAEGCDPEENPRGNLLRSPNKAHDVESLARITRCDKATMQEALKRFIAIGWIQEITFANVLNVGERLERCKKPTQPEIPQEDATPPQDTVLERKGTERKYKDNVREGGPAIFDDDQGVFSVMAAATSRPPTTRQKPDRDAAALEVLEHIRIQGKPFNVSCRDTKQNISKIRTRLKDVDDDLEGIKTMVSRMVQLWGPDQKMRMYLRIRTLFETEKFFDYYDQRDYPLPKNRGRKTYDATTSNKDPEGF